MKKFLSIILALALVLSIAPMTFATEGEATTIVYSPEYVFTGEVSGITGDLGKQTASFKFNGEKSSGVWGPTDQSRLQVTFHMYETGGTQAYVGATSTGVNCFPMNITVDADGTYIPTLNYQKWAYGGQIKMYIVDKTVYANNKWKFSTADGVNAIVAASGIDNSGVYCIADVDSWASTNEGWKPAEGKAIELKAGEYYLMLSVGKGSGKSTHSSERYYAYISSLKLERQPYVSVSSDAEEIEVGKTAKLSSATKLGDETDAGAAVTYSAAPEGVVSVNADGIVTALSVGNATITAKATIGEKEYTDTVNVKVNPIDKTHKFVFNYTMLSAETLAAATADGSYSTSKDIFSTSRGYKDGVSKGEEFVDDFSDFDTSKTDKWAVSRLGAANVYLFTDYMQLYTYRYSYGNNAVSGGRSSAPNINSRFVFKIDVEHPGTYDIEAEMYNFVAGTEADVYIVETSKVDGSEHLKEFAGYDRMTVDFLKTLPIDGRIGNIGADRTISTDFIATKELKKGEYYIILHMNSNNDKNVNDSNGTHLLCFKSITMTESDGSVVSSDTPVNAKANVSFATNVDGAIVTDSVARGTAVNLSAPETDKNGNVFKCWVKGTEENGVWVSSKANDTYKVITNTYLTAVYEAPSATDGKVVEFYNENGEYYATIAAVDGKAVLPENNPSLIGYEFAGWFTNEETELKAGDTLSADVTYAVAKYTAKQAIGLITNDNVKVNGAASTEYTFGAKIAASDKNATYWLRNGKIVKFGTSYEYLVWDGANIMSSHDTTITIRPTVSIDSTSVDGAYMIEYDKGNKSIAEVGILFGNSAKMTVDSCKYKATSQWNRDHGQFMAAPYGDTTESFARGYLIYNDGGSYKVIYTDAIAIQ